MIRFETSPLFHSLNTFTNPSFCKSIASKKLESRLIDLGLVTVISLTVISNSRHISFILDVILTSDIRFRLSAKNFAFLSMNKKTQKLLLCYDHSL